MTSSIEAPHSGWKLAPCWYMADYAPEADFQDMMATMDPWQTCQISVREWERGWEGWRDGGAGCRPAMMAAMDHLAYSSLKSPLHLRGRVAVGGRHRGGPFRPLLRRMP